MNRSTAAALIASMLAGGGIGVAMLGPGLADAQTGTTETPSTQTPTPAAPGSDATTGHHCHHDDTTNQSDPVTDL